MKGGSSGIGDGVGIGDGIGETVAMVGETTFN
jgi:hypothetical protein